MKWLAFVLVVLAAHGCAAAPSAHQKRIWDIARASNILFHDTWQGGEIKDGDNGAVHEGISRADARTAHRLFAKMTRRQKRQALHAALEAVPPNTVAIQGLAYVAAMNGFDVEINVQRILGSGYSDSKMWGHDNFRGLAEDTYGRVYEICERYPLKGVLRPFLREVSDGAGAEVLKFIRLDLLSLAPKSVLEIMATDEKAFGAVEYSLFEAGEREKRVLRRFRHHPSYSVRRVVWLCLRSLSDADIEKRQEEREFQKRRH